MFFCNTTARIVFLLLLSSQVSFVHALPVEGEVNELIVLADTAAQQTAGNIPPAPPGPYFSSAEPKETATSEPIQMPASVPISGQSVESAEQAAKIPAQIQVQKTAKTQSQAQKTYDIESTNPLTEWPHSVESASVPGSESGGESNGQWTPAPPAPPGPYGFVPNYTPRSLVNPVGRRYGYGNQYYPGNNAYGAPYGRPAPGMMPPQMAPSYSNPGYPNPSFSNPGYYGRPNQGGYNQGNYNQGNFNQGGFDQRIKRNNLNQSDMNQGKPK